jgi:hypothetical protein
MAAVENLNKTLYKIELILIKLIPGIMASMCLLNSILSYFCIDIVIFSYIGSCSLLTLLFLYVSSYVFKFCEYHRLFLHYISITWLINIIDYYVGIPLNDLGYLCLQMILTGVFVFLIVFLYAKNNKERTK